MSTPIYTPSSSSSGSSVDLTKLATKAQLLATATTLNTTISSTVATATTDTAINQKLLTGYAPSAGGVVSATDTIRSAIGKLANNTLPISIIANPLTGFSSTTGTVSASDTILSAVSKLTGNASALSASAVTLTGSQTLTNKMFGNLLTANAGVVVKGTANQVKVYPATDNAETSLALYNLTSGGTGWIVGQNIFSIGTGIFGIGSNGSGSIGTVLKADPTSGLITLTKTLAFPNTMARKRLALWDIGTPGDQTDHRFSGLGLATNALAYQLQVSTDSHVFYVATSATTSNELFRIAGTGAVSCGGDFSTGGVVSIAKNITFPIVDVRKRIAIFDDGIPSDQTDHRFNGFGKGAYQQVYQVKTTAENHVFYSATSATTSNELFRIAGTGAVSCAGTLASGSHTITGALTATTTANITGLATVGSLASTGNTTVGGTLTSGTHNITGALTATTTANITGATTVGSLTCSGNGTVGGTLQVSGALIVGGVQLVGGTLNYYSEYDLTTTFAGAFTTPNITIKLTRVGRKVSMDIQSDYSQAGGSSANVLNSTLALPFEYRPTAVSGFARGIHSGWVNSVFGMGNTYVLGSGFVTITGGSDSTNFATTGINGFQSHCLTWMV